MRAKNLLFSILAVFIATALLIGAAMADDSIVFRKNISKTPAAESEKAALFFMNFTIAPQASDGTVLDSVEYTLEDGTVVHTTTSAKPLIAVYIDDIGHEETLAPTTITGPDSVTGGISFGQRDAFVAYSFDDGATWKNVNVSRAADLSSFALADGTEYPGDTHSMVHQVAGNKVLAAWISRYCDEGNPTYSRVSDAGVMDEEYIAYMQETYGLPDLYLLDIWGVTGTQKSVDYELQGFPEVGEIPYGCVWTSRGTLIAGDDPTTEAVEAHYMVFTKAERLTSGVRDPNRLEVDCIKGAGCAVSWQEDPEGLRPGQGLGPGEGWSGAIVNAKTDIWYSYIRWEDFNLVDVDGDIGTFSETDTLPIEEYVTTVTDGTQPKPAVPMAIPIRLTDNNMCWADSTNTDPYCLADIDTETGDVTLEEEGADPDFCQNVVPWTNPSGVTKNICQTDDLRVLNGRVGASRPRLSLQPYTKPDGTAGAWAMIAYEETKAQGDVLDDSYDYEIEIGKNVWYHTFDIFHPEPVQQGGMINQPVAFNPETLAEAPEGEFLTFLDEFDNVVYETEIARRVAPTYQPVAKIGDTRTAGFLFFKQGILNQGGPADILARRIVVPTEAEGFDPTTDNPYLYEHMVCDNWIIPPGTEPGSEDYNPNYVEGLCGAPAINVSGTTNDLCYPVASADEPDKNCALNSFPWEGGTEDFPKVTAWDQFPENLDDQTWENPFDVAKGHRGFLDGDFLMAMYAWSPNWKANSVGNDKYNLYVRRSFDGGQTWTTTPADWCSPVDGTCGNGISDSVTDPSLCENFGTPNTGITTVCYSYGAGEFERARNVSQLLGTKVTILDPRYSPSGGLKKWVVEPYVDEYLDTSEYLIEDYDLTRDPSKFFMIYETGDNTTVDVGEAVPLDLFYSRATVYGDFWEWELVETSSGETEYRWPWVEKDREDLSGEASMLANPSGDFMYTDWNQWREEILEDGHELIYDSDTWFRRFFYNIWTEVAPSVSIVTTIPLSMYDIDEELNLVAFAKDNDRLGEGTEIVEYEWSIDGVVVSVSTSNAYNAPPRTLSKGWHGFSVRAKDHEGHWSNAATINILIADITKVTLPLVLKP
jgi:hypothetical protein